MDTMHACGRAMVEKGGTNDDAVAMVTAEAQTRFDEARRARPGRGAP